MVLPVYGGVPSIWNVCMFFFQVTLLAGYAYAHVSMKYLRPKWQMVLMLLIVLVSLTLLPFMIDGRSAPPEGTSPAIWLMGRLALSIGFPLFVISCLSPLLQRSFSLSGHRYSIDSYFLYASSNIGSMAALFFYPLVLERLLATGSQSFYWSVGFGILGLMVLACQAVSWKAQARGSGDKAPASPSIAVSWRRRLFWLFAAFVPSSLLLSVTTYITTDLTPIPLLWVLPLGIYLLTYVIAFSRNPVLPHWLVVRWLPFFLIALVPTLFFQIKFGLFSMIPLHLCTLLFVALGCHGELVASRPAVEKLTEFYVFIALGGALGGLCNSILFPMIFKEVLEYPLGMFLACFVINARGKNQASNHHHISISDAVIPAMGLAVTLAILKGAAVMGVGQETRDIMILMALVYGLMGLITFAMRKRPFRFALSYGVLLLSVGMLSIFLQDKSTYVTRNFYGVKKIIVAGTPEIRYLVHGTIIHGGQFVDGPLKHTPILYFHPSGPLGDVFSAHRSVKPFSDIAVVGLGVGSIAAYLESGEHVTFYEIDPAIKAIALNPDFFSFISTMKGRYSVVLGDARLKLKEAPDAAYDMIFLDAFSSDSVPVHLLTREAFDMYLSRLKPGGVLVFNVSNKYVELATVIARHARDKGLTCISRYDNIDEKKLIGKAQSEYAVVEKAAPVKPVTRWLVQNKDWKPVLERPGDKAWTDNYSSILSHLIFQHINL